MLTAHSRTRSERLSHLLKRRATEKARTLNLNTDGAQGRVHFTSAATTPPSSGDRAKASQSDGWKSHQVVFPRQAWLGLAVRMAF